MHTPRTHSRRQILLETLEDRTNPASFQPLGTLNTEWFYNWGTKVSGDGLVATWTGTNEQGFPQAYRWSESGGMIALDSGGRYHSTYAQDISEDGSVIVGKGKFVGHQGHTWTEAFRWTAEDGMVGLGYVSGLSYGHSAATGVTAGGGIIVGEDTSDLFAKYGFDWSEATGMNALANLSEYSSEYDLHEHSYANAISANGEVIVGYSNVYDDDNYNGRVATRWVAGQPVQPLDTSHNDPNSPYSTGTYATGVSADGNTVIGEKMGHQFSGIPEAFRWTPETGLQLLGSLQVGSGGFISSNAHGVSADGSVIVGNSSDEGQQEPFIWDSARGMRHFQSLLVDDLQLEAALEGWQLESATDISDDGTIIVGSGFNDMGVYCAWIADISANTTLNEFREASQQESGSAAPHSVLLTYTLKRDVEATRITFFMSNDAVYGKSDIKLDQLAITPQAIMESNGAIKLINEAPSQANLPGEHRLVLTFSEELFPKVANALTNGRIPYILAVAGEPPLWESEITFVGVYQSPITGKTIVRATGGDDEITINAPGTATFTPGEGLDRYIQRTTHIGPGVGVYVLGFDGDDTITGGNGNDTLVGGNGSDVYVFPAGQAGRKVIAELTKGASLDHDFLDFRDFHGGIKLDLRKRSVQAVGIGLTVQLPYVNSIETVLGTNHDDSVVGNNSSTVLIGRGGNDKLTAKGKKINLLVGDDLDDLELKDYAKLGVGIFEFYLPLLQWTMLGEGNDTLQGGSGFDVVIGGGGDDEITGGTGSSLLFGDGFNISTSTNFELDLVDLTKGSAKLGWAILSNLLGLLELTVMGNGQDTITGGKGFTDLIVGGGGDDRLDGKDGETDILLGGDGNDSLTSKATLIALLVGEEGNDTLVGGSSKTFFSMLIGDSFELNGTGLPLEFDYNVAKRESLVHLKANVLSIGSGNDVLDARSVFGFSVGGHGNDSLTTRGTAHIAFGDSFTLGYNVTLNPGELRQRLVGSGGQNQTVDLVLLGLVGDGWDSLTLAATVNVAFAGDGNDLVSARPSTRFNILTGNDGNDTVYGGPFATNAIVGGKGNDSLIGGNGSNLIFGDDFDFGLGTIPISLGALRLGQLNFGHSLLPLEDSNDTLFGGMGIDFLIGGAGDDYLEDVGGLNLLLGDGLSLELSAIFNLKLIYSDWKLGKLSYVFPYQYLGSGNDVIRGGRGADIMLGGAGNDDLDGRLGLDIQWGGEGQDTFIEMGLLDPEYVLWDYDAAEDLLAP